MSRGVTRAAAVLALSAFLALLGGTAGAQEIDVQDWTWWDWVLCVVFNIGCSGAPCTTGCQTCEEVPNLGVVCQPANGRYGGCYCVTHTNGAIYGRSLSGQSCYGVVVWG